MTRKGAKFEPDDDLIADEQPAACPFCGHDGAMDAKGRFERDFKIKRVGVLTEFLATIDEFHCPECNGTFQMRTTVREQ